MDDKQENISELVAEKLKHEMELLNTQIRQKDEELHCL